MGEDREILLTKGPGVGIVRTLHRDGRITTEEVEVTVPAINADPALKAWRLEQLKAAGRTEPFPCLIGPERIEVR